MPNKTKIKMVQQNLVLVCHNKFEWNQAGSKGAVTNENMDGQEDTTKLTSDFFKLT
jgi:hypothetical protein